jgi:hypothetical protein
MGQRKYKQKKFFTGYDRDHFWQKTKSHSLHVASKIEKRPQEPICGIVRTSVLLANTKFLASKPSACMRSSNSKMTSVEILEKEGSRLNFGEFFIYIQQEAGSQGYIW